MVRSAPALRISTRLAWLLPATGLALAYVWLSWQWAGSLGFPLDDGWIHAQFARNLATGHGFTYTGGRWVAGSTAPGWTVLLAIGYVLLRSILLSAFVLGLVLQLAAGLAGVRLAGQFVDDDRSLPVAGLSVALLPIMVWGAVSGMEVELSGVLVLAGFGAYLAARDVDGRGRWGGIALLAASCLARPENLVLLAIAATDFAWRARHRRQSLRTLVGAMALAAVILAPAVAFDLATTGKPLPTTFYAKSGPGLLRALSEGQTDTAIRALLVHGPTAVRKFGETLVDQMSAAAIFVLIGVVAAFRRDARSRGVWLLAVALIAAPYAMGAVAPQRVKPDNVRYTAQLVCLAAVLAFVGAQELGRWFRWPAARAIFPALLLLATAWRSVAGAPAYAASVKNIQELHVQAAVWMRTHLAADCRIAANDVGALAYFGGREILDIEGLVTPEALRYRGPGRGLQFVETVRPDYLVIFPHWYPEISRDSSRFPEVHRIGIPDNRVAAGDTLVVYRTPWTRCSMVNETAAVPRRWWPE